MLLRVLEPLGGRLCSIRLDSCRGALYAPARRCLVFSSVRVRCSASKASLEMKCRVDPCKLDIASVEGMKRAGGPLSANFDELVDAAGALSEATAAISQSAISRRYPTLRAIA